MTDKQLQKAIKTYADWNAQKAEMEKLKKAIYAELLERAEKKAEFPGGYVATYVEGYLQERDDTDALKAFYLLYHETLPKKETSVSATVKVYKSKK